MLALASDVPCSRIGIGIDAGGVVAVLCSSSTTSAGTKCCYCNSYSADTLVNPP